MPTDLKDPIKTSGSRLGFHLSLGIFPDGSYRTLVLVIVIVGLLIASVVAGGPASHQAYTQAADSSIRYAENGTSPVGAFNAYDQDGDVIEWSLSGPDDDLFTIDGGVLRFVEPPDYEDPQSAAKGGPRAEQNVYRVTVEASGGVHYVAVRVTDVDEAGTVAIDRQQPQVDRPLGASLRDEDDGVRAEGWQWARSRDGAAWTDIEGATSARRHPRPGDVGMYLRATVAYSDKFGAGKTAWAVRPVNPPGQSPPAHRSGRSSPSSTPHTRPRPRPGRVRGCRLEKPGLRRPVPATAPPSPGAG